MLREFISFIIRYSGIPWLIRNTWARNKVTIVLYHNPKPEVVARHLEFLARRYTFITLDDLTDALHSGDWRKIPRKGLIVTFDDGHKDNFALLPLFKQYGVRPTIYLCSQIAGTLRHYWFKLPGLQSLSLKRLPNDQRRQRLAERLGFSETQDYPPDQRQALSREEIEAMAPYVDFQSHTRFHPILTACRDEESLSEIALSKEELEALLGRPCRHFSYPNGDYSEREIRHARQAGYASARTIDVGWNHRGADPYQLRITGITDDASVNMMVAQLSGISMYLRYLSQGSLTGRHRPILPCSQPFADGAAVAESSPPGEA